MKKRFLCLVFNVAILFVTKTFAQNVAINEDGSAANPNAILDVKSANKGVLIPRMSTINRLSIPNTKGLLVYDSVNGSFFFNNGIQWRPIASGSGWLVNNQAATLDTSAKRVAIHEDGTIGNSNAILDIQSSNKGILIPRLSTTARLAIPNTKGLLVFDSTAGSFFFNTGIDWQNMASNVSTSPALSTGGNWTLTGNGGIDPANQFIGTTDVAPLNFRINNTPAGRLDPVNANIFFGMDAGYSNINGLKNIGIGISALQDNTSGTYNTANGSFALMYNTDGSDNTATGGFALKLNTTGYANTASGNYALFINSTGNYNTAVGDNALSGNTSSSYNTAIGYRSSLNHDVGWNNTFIGANSGANSNGLYNCVAIGNDAVCTASNQVRIGNSSTTSIGGFANWTNISDGRYKKNINENVKGLDFIMKLRPVTYQLDIAGISKKLNEANDKERDEFSKKAIAEKEKTILTGFVAQEVEKAAKEAGYNFSGVDVPKTENEFYGLRYSEFVVPLVKGMQEQQAIIVSQEKKIAELQEENKKITDMQKQINELKLLIQHAK
jgi:Chaperone of endosialidase